MRYRFDSDFDAEGYGRGSHGSPAFPVQEAGEELRRYVARARQGDGEAASGFHRDFERQIRRVVRRVLARGTPDASRLGRRVREELERLLHSRPGLGARDPQRLEDLLTARLCRAMLSKSQAPRVQRQALKETVRY